MMKKLFLIITWLSIMMLFMGCPKKTEPPPLPPVIEEPELVTEPIIEEPVVEPVDDSHLKKFELRTVHFDYNEFILTSEAKAILTDNAQQLMERNEIRVLIEGHCDDRGTEQYNLSLGQKRANAVKDFFVNYGIEDSRISTISFGEEKPLCNEESETCWWKNRRAEFIIQK